MFVTSTEEYLKTLIKVRDVIEELKHFFKGTEVNSRLNYMCATMIFTSYVLHLYFLFVLFYFQFIYVLQDRTKLTKNHPWFSNERMIQYNKIAERIFNNSTVSLWKSARQLQGLLGTFRDKHGVHVSKEADDLKANLAMNFICQKYHEDSNTTMDNRS